MPYFTKPGAQIRFAVVAFSLLAWLALLRPTLVSPAAASAGASLPITYCGVVGPLPASQVASAPVRRVSTDAEAPAHPTTLTWTWAADWVVMLIAMMLPTLAPPLIYIHNHSFARRRAWAMGLFLLGYGGVWLAVGIGLLGLRWLVQPILTISAYLPVAVTALLALVWQASPLKQRCLNRGHRHRSLAAFGAQADWDVLRLGLEHAGWCTASCWLLMLVPVLLPHGHLMAMVAVGLLMYCERLDPPGPLTWRWRGFNTALSLARLYLRSHSNRPRSLVHS